MPPAADSPDEKALQLNAAGLSAQKRGDAAAAEKLFAQALRLSPRNPDIHINLASLLRDQRRFALAEKGYRFALSLEPHNSAAWSELGKLYFKLWRRDDAVKCFEHALESNPGFENGWTRLIDALERTNRLDEAEKRLTEAYKRFPESPGLALQQARLMRRRGRAAEAVPLLEACLPRIKSQLPPAHPFFIEFYFELGQACDRANECARAFEAFVQANRIQAQVEAQGISRNAYIEGIAKLASAAPPPVTAATGGAPVFLVGFPRSGTTLLDQILSSHPALHVAEERAAVDAVIAALLKQQGGGDWPDAPGYPRLLEKIRAEDLPALQKIFYAVHGEIPAGCRLVDKLPLNMLHVPLIRRVFPGAAFILALRHPCDAVLSCFMQRFTLNTAMVNFLDIGDAARLYDAVFTLWRHYEAQPGFACHRIAYEDVVADFRPTVAALLDFLGLPWDDAVLAYDKTARARDIHTPSYHQVTEKIYTRASGRWRRYRAELAPVLDILRPHIAALGYELDDGESPE